VFIRGTLKSIVYQEVSEHRKIWSNELLQHVRQSASVKKCTCFWNWTIAVLH